MAKKDLKDITKLTEKEFIDLAFLSSWINKKYWNEKSAKYLGKKYQYKTLQVPKEFRGKPYNARFHVVYLFSNPSMEHQLDRIFVVDFEYRNKFRLYNISQDKKSLINVELFHDDLFQMHKYLIEHGYEIKNP